MKSKITQFTFLIILLSTVYTQTPETNHPLLHMTKHVTAKGIRDIALRKTVLEVQNISLAPYMRHKSTLWLKITLKSKTAFPSAGQFDYLVYTDDTLRLKEFKLADGKTKANMAIARQTISQPILGRSEKQSLVNWIKLDFEKFEGKTELFVMFYDVNNSV